MAETMLHTYVGNKFRPKAEPLANCDGRDGEKKPGLWAGPALAPSPRSKFEEGILRARRIFPCKHGVLRDLEDHDWFWQNRWYDDSRVTVIVLDVFFDLFDDSFIEFQWTFKNCLQKQIFFICLYIHLCKLKIKGMGHISIGLVFQYQWNKDDFKINGTLVQVLQWQWDDSSCSLCCLRIIRWFVSWIPMSTQTMTAKCSYFFLCSYIHFGRQKIKVIWHISLSAVKIVSCQHCFYNNDEEEVIVPWGLEIYYIAYRMVLWKVYTQFFLSFRIRSKNTRTSRIFFWQTRILHILEPISVTS